MPIYYNIILYSCVNVTISTSNFINTTYILVTFLQPCTYRLCSNNCCHIPDRYCRWIHSACGNIRSQLPFLNPIITFYDMILPFYVAGLGWLVPALIAIVITSTLASVFTLLTTVEDH